MDIDMTDGPETGEAPLADAQAIETEAKAQEAAEEGSNIEQEESEDAASGGLEEVIVDGIAHQVPKALKGAFMMQADYTRKTMEMAELRRAIEAERAAIHQAGAEEVGARAHLLAIDEQIARFQKVDWDSWEQDDPFEAQKGWRQYQQLQQARGAAAGRLAGLAQQRGIERQRETARLIEEGRAELARDIKGWSDALAAELLETGVRTYGFDRGEIEEFTDPRMVKVLHDAHRFHLLEGQRKQAQAVQAAQGVRPAARVGGGSAPASGLDDRLSAEEWTRRRNKQVRKA